MHKWLLFLLLALGTFTAKAQKPDTVRVKSANDSLNRVRDSVTSKPVLPKILAKKNKKRYNPDSTHLPSKAVKRSLMIPGWGQLYNGAWWKVPLIYGGLGSLGLAVEFNSRYYRQYLAVYNLRRNGERPGEGTSRAVTQLFFDTQNVSVTAIEGAVSSYQRNMQLSILGIAGAWGIQVIEAYIQAKFIHSYTMDRDLSFKVTPGVLPTGPLYASGSLSSSVMPVVKLTFTFK
jgi:hypothetical protein